MSTTTLLVNGDLKQGDLALTLSVRTTAAPATVAATTAQQDRVTLSGTTAKAPAAADYTNRVKPSGNKDIDALLAGGTAWWHTAGADGTIPSAAAQHDLTFSFISDASGLNETDAEGFQALDDSQQETIKDALDYISSVVNVNFTEVDSGGDIQFGSNFQDESGGYSRYPNPSTGSQVMLANNQSSFSGNWAKGTYEWEVILHETGHALGLKHPGKYNAGGGTTPGPYLPASKDNRGNTIMSYINAKDTTRIVSNGGMLSKSTINPDTYQADDIAALQYLYGEATSPEAATYKWSTGQIFSETIWNSNSDSSIDLSNQTLTNVVDLRAGKKSSIAVRDAYAEMPYDKATYAKLTSGGKKLTSVLGVPTYTGKNNLTIAKGSHINSATGGSGSDTFITNNEGDSIDGSEGNDAIYVTGGDAALTGGDGDDTVYIVKKAGTQWTLSDDHSTLTQTRTDKKTHVTTTLTSLTLNDVEHVKFWNGTALKATGISLLA